MKRHSFLITLSLINSFFIFAWAMFVPLFGLFVEEFSGGGPVVVGNFWSLFLIVTGILAWLLSGVEDRFLDYKRFVALGYLLRGLAWAGYLFVNSIPQLVVMQILLGVGEALGIPAYNALYSSKLQEGMYARGWGWTMSFNFFAAGIGALTGGMIAHNFGFPVLYGTMATIAFACFVMVSVVKVGE